MTISGFQKLSSQEYKTGLGVRIQPYFNCITAKHFFSPKVAVEGLLNVKDYQAVVEIMAEYTFNFEEQPGLSWYCGLGGNMKMPKDDNIIIGAVGILGLEFTFQKAPINLSLDWKPSIEIIGGEASYPAGFGFSVRYVFKP